MICENHEPIICFPPHDSADALGALPHGIKLEKFVFVLDPPVGRHKLNPFDNDGVDRILHREPHHDHTPAVVLLEVDSFCNFPTSDGQENSTSPHITGLPVALELVCGLQWVLLLEKDEPPR